MIATNTGGNSQPSNAVQVTTPPNPPGAPLQLKATTPAPPLGQTEIDLSWVAADTAQTGFTIQRKTGSSGFIPVASVPANQLTYQDTTVTGLTPGTSYLYQVIASSPNGNSQPSVGVAAATLPNPPVVPASLNLQAVSQSSIKLTWPAALPGVTNFKIYRAVGSGQFFLIATVSATTTSRTDTGLAAKTLYTYQLSAGNSGGDSTPVTASVSTLPPLPNAPASIDVVSQPGPKVVISWTPVSPAPGGYSVLRAVGNGTFSTITLVAPAFTSYTDTKVSSGITYRYAVSAYNATGSGPLSPIKTVIAAALAPAAPSGLTARAVSPSSSILEWSDNSNNETGFDIQRSTAGGSFVFVIEVGANLVTYQDNNLTPGTTYQYRVQANNSGSVSAFSTSGNVTTPPTVPPAPSTLQVTSLSAAGVGLSWTYSGPTPQGFSVERASGGGAFSTLNLLLPTYRTFTDTHVTAGATYTYRVRAYNQSGPSLSSPTVTRTIP